MLALLGCGIATCLAIELPQRKELEKEKFVGTTTVASKKKNKNDDLFPFLRKSSNKFPFETFSRGKSAKRKAIAVGPMDKIFQKEKGVYNA